jgi:peptidoglycan/LPS O-acetylase OafA/YrhL
MSEGRFRSDRSKRATIGGSFSPRSNSLNFLRLALAGIVVVSHTIDTGGYGNDRILGKTTLGTIAVYGFFGISGFLIAGSAQGSSVGRFLWHRILRIVPAFWVCLIVIAFVFGLIGWFHGKPACGVSCYVREADGPFSFLGHNFWLKMNEPSIAHTLHGVPLPTGWNGSLWTLFYEFLCYLILAGLAVTRILRERAVVASLAIVAWLFLLCITAVPSFNGQFNVLTDWAVGRMLIFVPIFLTGALLQLYRDKIPDSGYLAWGCLGLLAFSLVLPLGAGIPGFTLTSTDLLAPVLAYLMLWLGIHLPFEKVGAKNDYSYGVYIYAYPVSQLLALWGVYRWGYAAYTGLVILGTVPLAVASWWLVEKHALKLKKLKLGGGRLRRSPAPVVVDPLVSG